MGQKVRFCALVKVFAASAVCLVLVFEGLDYVSTILCEPALNELLMRSSCTNHFVRLALALCLPPHGCLFVCLVQPGKYVSKLKDKEVKQYVAATNCTCTWRL